jgi:hypothetical protein
MWGIAKYKAFEFQLFEESMKTELKDCEIFRPLFRKDSKKIPLLGSYCFIHHPSFADESLITRLKFKKGVNYFLNNYAWQQKPITDFIHYLQSHMTRDGILDSKFFFQYLCKQGVFLEGPLKSLIFNVLEDYKKTLKISVEGMSTPIIINKERVSINFL